MKRLLLIATLLLPLTAVAAEDYCIEVSDAARAVMTNRLNGISQVRQDNLAKDILDGEELSVVRELIRDAYQQPESRDKQDASDSFALTWLIKCSRNEGAL